MVTSNGNDDRRLPHDRVPSTVSEDEAPDRPVPEGEAERAPGPSQTMRVLSIAIPAVLGFIGLVLIGTWLLSDREPVDAPPRLPEGPQQPAERAQQPASQPQAGGPTQPQTSVPSTQAPGGQPDTVTQAAGTGETSGPVQPVATGAGGGSWPWFRGPARDGIAHDASGLARSWPSGRPREIWSKRMLGPGHAGAAIRNGRVYTLDYDQGRREDVLRCLSLADGSDIWRQSYPVEIKDNHGITRTVPAVTDRFVVAIGPLGHVTCARADSGDVVWQVDLKKTYGTKIPSWYTGQCPLIDGGKAILAPGGSALMVAVDCASGQVVWQTPNPRGWQMTHSSITPMQVAGQKTYVYPASGGVVGVAAADGSIVFEYPGWTVKTANAPSALPVGDEKIFLCGGYGAGAMLLSVRGGTPAPVWRIPQSVFGSHQHTPIFYKNHIFGVSMDRQLVCLGLDGKRVWSSGHTTRFGIGPYIIADGLIYVLGGDDGRLVMAEATAAGYKELGGAKVLSGTNAWGPMALADGKLVCRDRDTMICLDVKNP